MPTFISPDKNIFSPQEADFSEVARYLGYRKAVLPDSQVQKLIKKACDQLLTVIKPQGTFEIFDLTVTTPQGQEDGQDLGGWQPQGNGKMPGQSQNQKPEIKFSDVSFKSLDLARNLKNCNKVYLMAATIGPQVDALIRRANVCDPPYAAVLQATGAMYIEKFVDYINDLIKKEVASMGSKMGSKVGGKTRPRYSPGFGDVPLDLQKVFFRLLPCARIGLSLMDTLIMAPEKSVTAFIGVMEDC